MTRVFGSRRRVLLAIAALALAVVFVVADGDRILAGADGFDKSASASVEAAPVALAATQHQKTVFASAFNAMDSNVTRNLVSGSFCASATGLEGSFNFWQLNAPFQIPVGARITGASADVYDADAGSDVTIYVANTSSFTSNSIVVAMASIGNAGFGTITGTGNWTVADTNALWIVYTGTGSTGICEVEIEYEIPSDHQNLVYTPLAQPCTVLDTFGGTGVYAGPWGKPDGVITVEIASPAAAQVTAQGGNACAETAVPSDAVAASINVLARAPQEQGNIRAAAAGSTPQPVTNYSLVSGMTNSNEVTLELASGSIDMNIGGLASLTDSVQVRAIVLGYYTPLPNLTD